MAAGPLLVIVADNLSEIAAKGEVVPRYYNPADLFGEVHLLLVNDDRPDPTAVQSMVGRARLVLHNLPLQPRLFSRTLGFRPALLGRWAAPAVDLAGRIRPALVRCHATGLHAYVASRIKRALGVPYVVSLHGNPDVDSPRARLARTWREKLVGHALASVERIGVREADHVIAVYEPIVPYLRAHGVSRYSVIYNAVSVDYVAKPNYTLDRTRVRAICVGRQDSRQKDPTPIIDAVAEMPSVGLTLIGRGDLHEGLVQRVQAAGLQNRIQLIPALPNREILIQMGQADIFVYASMNYELSKTCIEAALTGLPIVLNNRGGHPAPELVGGHFVLVDGSRESYRRALTRLIENDAYREQQGRRAAAFARERWAPATLEARVVDLYRRLMAEAAGHVVGRP